MPYLKLNVFISESQFDNLEALLLSCGALSVSLEDAGDEPILEPGVAETPLWQKLRLSALFPENVNQKKLSNKLKAYLDEASFNTIEITPLMDEAWELKWLEYFQPISFGNRLWIGTTSHTPSQAFDAMIYLEPGLAFGTGTHPSTYLCLKWLVSHELSNKTLIDYGCGSGILSIAAMKLGANKLLCIDNDPQALIATQANAQKNNVSVETYLPENLPNRHVDGLLANILANPLISLAPRFIDLLKPNADLVLAGILAPQARPVEAAYEPQIQWQEQEQLDEWVRISGYKK